MPSDSHLDENGFVVLDDEQPDDPHVIPAHLEPQAIAGCTHCDVEGYRAGHVCDHRQHSTPEGRQAAREIVRAALAGTRTRATPPKSASVDAGPSESTSEVES